MALTRKMVAVAIKEIKKEDHVPPRSPVPIKKEEVDVDFDSKKELDNEETESESEPESEDEAPPLDKNALKAVIKDRSASPFSKGLAHDILYAHRSRNMGCVGKPGRVYKRYVTDDTRHGLVYDRRQGGAVKRLLPLPRGERCQVYDRLTGRIRLGQMMDGLIRRNEGKKLWVEIAERDAGNQYCALNEKDEKDFEK